MGRIVKARACLPSTTANAAADLQSWCNPGFPAELTGHHFKEIHCSPIPSIFVTLLQAQVEALYQAASVEIVAQYEKMVRKHEAEEAAAAAVLQGLIENARAAQRRAEAVAERHMQAIRKLHRGCSQQRPAGMPAWRV